jgi:hypothetical protein
MVHDSEKERLQGRGGGRLDEGYLSLFPLCALYSGPFLSRRTNYRFFFTFFFA